METKEINGSWVTQPESSGKPTREYFWQKLQKALVNKKLLIATAIIGTICYWLDYSFESDFLFWAALAFYLSSITYLSFWLRKKLKRIHYLLWIGLVIVETAIAIYVMEHINHENATLGNFVGGYFFTLVLFQIVIVLLSFLKNLLVWVWHLPAKIFKKLSKFIHSPATQFFIKKRLVFIVLILAVTGLIWQTRQLNRRVTRLESAIGENRLSCNEKRSVAEAKQSVVRIIGRNGQGSGFVVANGNRFGFKDKHIITNYHVVAQDMNPKIVLPDYTLLQGKVIAADEAIDVAIITTEEGLENIPKLRVSWFNNLESLDELFAIGYPLGTAIRGEATANKGHFVALRENKDSPIKMVQTNINLGPGMSGGPLIDVCGKVYGINTLSSQSLGLSLSASDFREQRWSQMFETEDQTADIEKIAFKPNESPVECVKAFYNYQTTGELKKAYNLLSEAYTDWSFERWKKGYQNTLYIVFVKAEEAENKENTVFVKFYSADLNDEQFTERFFEGEQQVKKYNGQWKLEEANIKEIKDPDWKWFYNIDEG